MSAIVVARQTMAASDVTAPQAADRAELGTSPIARLLASDMREELLAIMREISDRHAFAERLAYRPEEADELPGISRELVHDLLRTGQLGSVKAGRRLLISRHHLESFLAGDRETAPGFRAGMACPARVTSRRPACRCLRKVINVLTLRGVPTW